MTVLGHQNINVFSYIPMPESLVPRRVVVDFHRGMLGLENFWLENSLAVMMESTSQEFFVGLGVLKTGRSRVDTNQTTTRADEIQQFGFLTWSQEFRISINNEYIIEIVQILDKSEIYLLFEDIEQIFRAVMFVLLFSQE